MGLGIPINNCIHQHAPEGAEGWSLEKELQGWKKEAVKWEGEVQRLREMMWLDLGGWEKGGRV